MKNKHSVSSRSTLREALAALNVLSGGAMTLFVVDPSGAVVGSVTDGDIRRALVAGASLSEPVEVAAHRGFLALRPGDDKFSVFAEARRRGVRLLPVLDADDCLQDVVDLQLTKTSLPIEAVLMAGGKGERLRPLTLDCPKPLLKVGRKVIIDYNVDELLSVGASHIYVTVNYLKEQLISHFDNPRFAGKVSCVPEPQRMGTIGSLSLLPPLTQPTLLVMNSDLLTTLDFEALYLHHRSSGNDLTMAVVPYTVSVPFSIVRSEGDRVVGLTEKPTFNYFAGAGVYIMRSELVSRIKPDEYLDAPDFILKLIADGFKVGQFPIVGRWIDIGSPDDYRYACEIMTS